MKTKYKNSLPKDPPPPNPNPHFLKPVILHKLTICKCGEMKIIINVSFCGNEVLTKVYNQETRNAQQIYTDIAYQLSQL